MSAGPVAVHPGSGPESGCHCGIYEGACKLDFPDATWSHQCFECEVDPMAAEPKQEDGDAVLLAVLISILGTLAVAALAGTLVYWRCFRKVKEPFPGMTITYALIPMVDKISERSDLARINEAKVLQLTKNGVVCGVRYEKRGKEFSEEGPVILATGGFGADFTNDSLLAKYRPDLLHLPVKVWHGAARCGGSALGSFRLASQLRGLRWWALLLRHFGFSMMLL